jgi:hypothetical protein
MMRVCEPKEKISVLSLNVVSKNPDMNSNIRVELKCVDTYSRLIGIAASAAPSTVMRYNLSDE